MVTLVLSIVKILLAGILVIGPILVVNCVNSAPIKSAVFPDSGGG